MGKNRIMLQGGSTAFTCSDTNGVHDIVDEDLAVADASGSGYGNGLQNLVESFIVDDNINSHLGQTVHLVGESAVHLSMAELTPESSNLTVIHAMDADSGKTLLHLLQLGGANDDLYFFHTESSCLFYCCRE